MKFLMSSTDLPCALANFSISASSVGMVVDTADAEIASAGVSLEYEVGTMIEIPRAALTADEIAKEADFFCGINWK